MFRIGRKRFKPLKKQPPAVVESCNTLPNKPTGIKSTDTVIITSSNSTVSQQATVAKRNTTVVADTPNVISQQAIVAKVNTAVVVESSNTNFNNQQPIVAESTPIAESSKTGSVPKINQEQITDSLKYLRSALNDLQSHCSFAAKKFNLELFPDDETNILMTNVETRNITEAAQEFSSKIFSFQKQKSSRDSEDVSTKFMSKMYPIAKVLLRLAGFVGDVIFFPYLPSADNTDHRL